MILGQSAATAASLAIDDDISVQEVQYEKLRQQLEKGDQRLVWKIKIFDERTETETWHRDQK